MASSDRWGFATGSIAVSGPLSPLSLPLSRELLSHPLTLHPLSLQVIRPPQSPSQAITKVPRLPPMGHPPGTIWPEPLPRVLCTIPRFVSKLLLLHPLLPPASTPVQSNP